MDNGKSYSCGVFHQNPVWGILRQFRVRWDYYIKPNYILYNSIKIYFIQFWKLCLKKEWGCLGNLGCKCYEIQKMRTLFSFLWIASTSQ